MLGNIDFAHTQTLLVINLAAVTVKLDRDFMHMMCSDSNTKGRVTSYTGDAVTQTKNHRPGGAAGPQELLVPSNV